ncbi:MAG: YhbY family RNA-binding protein, partial [Rariglobus sp.]
WRAARWLSVNMYDFPLTGAQKTFLRGLGQTTEPSVMVGRSGLTPEFFAELQKQLNLRELVKIRFTAADRKERPELLARLVDEGRCVSVGAVGATALVFRQNPDPARRVIELE